MVSIIDALQTKGYTDQVLEDLAWEELVRNWPGMRADYPEKADPKAVCVRSKKGAIYTLGYPKRITKNVQTKNEFSRLIGPLIRSKLVEELIKLLEKTLPLRDHVRPGQVVWNVVSISTRADAYNPLFIPVVLTMVHEEDIEQLREGLHPSIVAQSVIARMMHEAHAQGGLLSTRDIGLLT